MERGLKIWYVTCILLLKYVQSPVHGEQQVPCYLIFGDSLVDNGNNNGLATRAKANFSPYGNDFPYGPTGRFCNGRTMADIIAELLGFENYIPSFATPSGQDILKGINYASAAAGIHSASGQQMGARIRMDAHLGNHLTTVSRIAAIFGDSNATANYLSKCIYSVGMGNNDFTNNYFMPEFYPNNQALYRLGAKVALFGLGQLGVLHLKWLDIINNAVQIFNNRLKSLVDDLNNSLSSATFIYVNTYSLAAGDASSAVSELNLVEVFWCLGSSSEMINFIWLMQWAYCEIR
ncbi:hypothetical protein ACB094_05G211500 [Castanea mollissima]